MYSKEKLTGSEEYYGFIPNYIHSKVFPAHILHFSISFSNQHVASLINITVLIRLDSRKI